MTLAYLSIAFRLSQWRFNTNPLAGCNDLDDVHVTKKSSGLLQSPGVPLVLRARTHQRYDWPRVRGVVVVQLVPVAEKGAAGTVPTAFEREAVDQCASTRQPHRVAQLCGDRHDPTVTGPTDSADRPSRCRRRPPSR